MVFQFIESEYFIQIILVNTNILRDYVMFTGPCYLRVQWNEGYMFFSLFNELK